MLVVELFTSYLVSHNTFPLSYYITYELFGHGIWDTTKYRVFIKYCVFSQFTATHPSRLDRCKRPSKLSTLCKCTVIPIGW